MIIQVELTGFAKDYVTAMAKEKDVDEEIFIEMMALDDLLNSLKTLDAKANKGGLDPEEERLLALLDDFEDRLLMEMSRNSSEIICLSDA